MSKLLWNSLTFAEETAEIPFIKSLDDYYPGGIIISESNYLGIYETINTMLGEMETLFFQVSCAVNF